MSPETVFQKFVRDALGRIEERVIRLEVNQKWLLNGRRDVKTFWMRVGGAVVIALILTTLGVIFGKSL